MPRAEGESAMWSRNFQTVHNFVGDCGMSFIANRG